MKKHLLYALPVMVMLHGCVSDIHINTGYEEKVVVNCVLSGDDVQTLSLTRSVKITESYLFSEITEAEAILFMNGKEAGRFERKGYNNWQLEYTPEAGATYTLRVELPDGTVLSASTTMPSKNIILPDPANDRSHSKNFIQYSGDLPSWAFVLNSDRFNFEEIKPAASDKLLDHIGTDHPLTDRFNEDGNMLSELPQSTTPAYMYYLRLMPSADVAAEGISFCIQFVPANATFIGFRTASNEYDRYLKSSLQKMIICIDEDDPAIWFDESSVYSNIEKGTGIFGAYIDAWHLYLQ